MAQEEAKIVGKLQLSKQEAAAFDLISSQPEDERGLLTGLLEAQQGRNQRFYEFLVELRRLELKYEDEYAPFYQQRYELLQGKPAFWLKVLTNNAMSEQFISEKDKEVLAFVTDIRTIESPESDDYRVEFIFQGCPHFDSPNLTLTKSFLHDEDQVLAQATGTKIPWKKGKDPSKEQRRIITNRKTQIREIPVDSFFHFFADSAEEGNTVLGRKETDEELGVELRDEIVPFAVLYYLGTRKRAIDEAEASDHHREEQLEGVTEEAKE